MWTVRSKFLTEQQLGGETEQAHLLIKMIQRKKNERMEKRFKDIGKKIKMQI